MSTVQTNSPAPVTAPASRTPALAKVALGLVAAAMIGAGVVAATKWTGGAADHLTDKEIAARAATFAAAGTLVPEPAPLGALAELPLSPDQRGALAERIKAGTVHLGVVRVWDDVRVDGDVVDVHSAGYSVRVSLGGTPERLVLPLDGTGVTVTGVRDGVGGITVGMEASGRRVPLPVLVPGQSVMVGLK